VGVLLVGVLAEVGRRTKIFLGGSIVKSLSNVVEKELHWVQPKALQRRFDLRSEEDDLFGTLEFTKPLGSLATATSDKGAWTFKRMGFFRPRVTVRVKDTEDDLAVYHPKWTGSEGKLECTDGEVFVWKLTSFWSSRYEIVDAAGNVLVEYKLGSGQLKLSDLFKSQARMVVKTDGQKVDKLDVLVLLGWYLLILMQEDTAVSTTVVVTAATAAH
jgi:hypothetical protein